MKTLRGDHCLCRACGEYFNSTSAFDKHRIGKYDPMERRCRSTAEMLKLGMSQNATGFWIRHKKRSTDHHRDSIGADQAL